eukprot:Amastigsp_a339342_1176.p4 type:complete len:182 gc:universal Amastigsp_a339342_1176:949-1494(+)
MKMTIGTMNRHGRSPMARPASFMMCVASMMRRRMNRITTRRQNVKTVQMTASAMSVRTWRVCSVVSMSLRWASLSLSRACLALMQRNAETTMESTQTKKMVVQTMHPAQHRMSSSQTTARTTVMPAHARMMYFALSTSAKICRVTSEFLMRDMTFLVDEVEFVTVSEPGPGMHRLRTGIEL